MAKKKQNISMTGPLSWQTIKSYLGGELSEKEMYNLERKIQNEQFEQEAFNGFYEHAPASMEKDLDELRIKIQRKTGNTLKVKKVSLVSINWKLVAAVVTIIIFIPIIIFLFLRTDDGKDGMTEDPSTTKSVQIIQQQSSTNKNVVSEKDSLMSDLSTSEDERQDLENQQVASSGVTQQTNRKSTVQKVSEPERVVLDNLDKQTLTNDQLSDLEENTAKASDLEAGKDIPSFEMTEEISSKREAEASSAAKVNPSNDRLSRTPARPPGGMDGYKAYLTSQLLNSFRSAQGTFIIKVVVENNGQLKSVKVSEGANRRTNKKLQSIVEKAPSWTSANEEGKAIQDTATFSLILK